MTQLELFTQSETDQASSQRDTPANPLVKPGSAEAVKMTDTSGQKYFPLFSKSDQIGLFVKTFLGTSLWASTRCFLTWQTKPITQSKHFILELYPSTPHIDVCDSGLSQEMWATPNTMDHLPQRSKEALERQANTTRKGRTRPANLREQVNPETVEAWEKAQAPQMWPTPIASTGGPYKNHKGDEKKIPSSGNPLATAVAMWPTPTTDIGHERSREYWINRIGKHQIDLQGAVKMWPTPTANEDAAGTPNGKMQRQLGNHPDIRGTTPEEWKRGSLNPQWVEWLMGYPEGWTDLKD